MKKVHYKLSGWLVLAMVASFSITQCTESPGLNDNPINGNDTANSVIEGADLTEAEIDGIIFMREEEKLARDVYLYLYEIHPLRPFLNISKSEQAHMDAIKHLIDIFELEDPVGENPEGVFRNENLQELYNQLIEKGSTSREEALSVGALIEEVDIIDLQTQLETIAQNEKVIRVYTNLCRASENHLRAFTGVLALYGVEYTPVKLSQEEFDRIIND
jgi:hypothetical protein